MRVLLGGRRGAGLRLHTPGPDLVALARRTHCVLGSASPAWCVDRPAAGPRHAEEASSGICGLGLVVGYTVMLGGQRYFFGQFRSYLTGELGGFAPTSWTACRGSSTADFRHYAVTSVPRPAFAVVWSGCQATPHPGERWRSRPARRPRAVIGWFAGPWHLRAALGATPDVLYLDAARGLFRALCGPQNTLRGDGASTPLAHRAQAQAAQARPRNVLLVIIESTARTRPASSTILRASTRASPTS